MHDPFLEALLASHAAYDAIETFYSGAITAQTYRVMNDWFDVAWDFLHLYNDAQCDAQLWLM